MAQDNFFYQELVMNSSFRKRMIVTAIASLLTAPVWAQSGTSQSGTYGSGTGTTAGSMGSGATGAGTSRSSTALGSGTPAGTMGSGTSAAGTESTRLMGAGAARADNPLYSRTVDNLIGADIVDSTGDDIGEIEKVVLTWDRRTAHAVVSVGGFLGMGEHDIAVSLDELKPHGDDKWQLSATKEQLEARPEYQSDDYVELEGDQPISGSITDFAAFETDQQRGLDTPLDNRAVQPMENMGQDRSAVQPSTGSGAAGWTNPTTGSGTSGSSTTK